MVWSLLVLGIVGIPLGFSFRVPALIAATFVTVAVCLAHDAFVGCFGWHTMLFALAMAIVLQAAYLAGLLARFLWRRGMSRKG